MSLLFISVGAWLILFIEDEGNVTPPPSGDIESSHLQERKDDHEIMIKSSLDDALNSLYPNH